MRKLLNVAVREFKATVLTRAFLLGVLIPPFIGGTILTLMPILMNQAAPRITGTIAVVDKSGAVVKHLDGVFAPKSVDARRQAKFSREFGKMSKKAPGLLPANAAEQAAQAAQAAVQP